MFEQLSGSKGLVLAVFILLLLTFAYTAVYNAIESKHSSLAIAATSVSEFNGRVQKYAHEDPRQAIFLSDIENLRNLSSRLDGPEKEIVVNLRNQALQSESDLAGLRSASSEAQIALEEQLTRSQTLKTYVIWAAMFFLFAYFLLVILPLIAKISRTVVVEEEAKKESADIMDTVNEGLFLLGRDGEFGLEQSRSLREIFRLDNNIEGNFFDFISNFVTDKTVNTAREYFDLLLSKRLKERLIKDLNPLTEVEFHLLRRDGSYENRYLNFNFNRVLRDDGEVTDVLVSVNDVTKEVELARELEETREEQEAQMQLMVHLLNQEPGMLDRFVSRAQSGLDEINEVLERRGHSDAEIRSKLVDINTQAHRLKGDSAALGLHGFEFTMHDFETQVSQLQQSQEQLTGKTVLPAVTALKSSYLQLGKIQDITNRLAQFNSERSVSLEGASETLDGAGIETSVVAASNEAAVTRQLRSLALELGERNEMNVNLTAYGLTNRELEAELEDTLLTSTSQFLRNSIAHGFSSVEQRLKSGKSDFLNVVLSLTESSEAYHLTFRDDGEGINREEVVNKAIQLGIVDAAIDPSKASLGQIIFHPSFSRTQDADLDSGRGVGLHAVYKLVKSHGGSLRMSQMPGRYCQFQITLPKNLSEVRDA